MDELKRRAKIFLVGEASYLKDNLKKEQFAKDGQSCCVNGRIYRTSLPSSEVDSKRTWKRNRKLKQRKADE